MPLDDVTQFQLRQYVIRIMLFIVDGVNGIDIVPVFRNAALSRFSLEKPLYTGTRIMLFLRPNLAASQSQSYTNQ